MTVTEMRLLLEQLEADGKGDYEVSTKHGGPVERSWDEGVSDSVGFVTFHNDDGWME